MAKYLVVVESPAKARTINKFLGRQYAVRASYGHVRDLPKSEMGVDIENGFEPKYVRLRDSSKHIKAIKEAAKDAETILIATDPDREGEAIGWHVAELLNQKNGKTVQRITFNEITKRTVKEATRSPREINDSLVDAQQARRILDRLVGYKLSPLVQWGVRRGLSAGRVQSVAVRMVCEREAEIRNFIPVEHWSIHGDFAEEGGAAFEARLFRMAGSRLKVEESGATLASEEEAGQVLAGLEGASYRVVNIERKEYRRKPYPPFITSSLQQEASRRLSFSPRRTMALAQQLYEGIDIGEEGSVGLITYMRTDSTRVASEAVEEARSYVSENFPAAMLPNKPNSYASKKGAQDAHEAIRPTSAMRKPDEMRRYLDEDQLKLYTLIWQRFVASQMTPAVFDQTAIDIDAQTGDDVVEAVRRRIAAKHADGFAEKPKDDAPAYQFRATGSIMKFPGFTALYDEGKDEDANDDSASSALPEIAEGADVAVDELRPEQHFTKPPPRYSEATLVRALEENGIGRPSTYASIINTIIDRGYVVREKRRLQPTDLGEEVNRMLVGNFPDILDYNFTAELESNLDRVEEGEVDWRKLVGDFYEPFQKDLEQTQKRLVAEKVGEDIACPECGAPMEIREGRFGMFIACTRYPECKTTVRPKRAEPVETEEVCENCGAKMVIREGRFGRFMACSRYPKCKNTHDIDEQGNKVARQPKEEPKPTGQPCPQCKEGELLIRKNRRGEEFYGCSRYPKCKHTKPMELHLPCPKPDCNGELESVRRNLIACNNEDCDMQLRGRPDKQTACPKCGNAWTMIHKQRNKPERRYCPAETCDFERPIEEESAATGEAPAEQGDA